MTPFRAGCVAFAAGFGSMTLELTAVRLMAPYFGTSVYVWTNVIGVTLLALALGAWIGGRLADRGHGTRFLTILLATAGALSLLVPLVVRPFAAFLLPAEMQLEEAFSILVQGSLVVTLVLFAPPVLLVGATSPILVRGQFDEGVPVGRGSGTVWAISTLGSLLGTFGSTHWFVPYLGARWTVVIAGLVLLLAAGLVQGARVRSTAIAGVALVVGLGVGAYASGLPEALPMNGWQVLEERDSSYQHVRVLEREGEEGEGATRSLLVNEGLDSFQSHRVEGRVLTDAYYDNLGVTALLPAAADGRLDVLILGLGGGSVVPLLHALYEPLETEIAITGVEIDPTIISMSRQYLWLEAEQVRILEDLDGRVALEHLEQAWDLIVLDAYASQVHIPPHLASREFFELAERRLAPGGLLVANVGSMGAEDPVLSALGNTAASVLDHVEVWPVARSRNAILLATSGERPQWDRVRERYREIAIRPPQRVEQDFLDTLDTLVTHALYPGGVERWSRDSSGDVLTDDSTWIDVLQMRALEGSR